MPMMWPFKLLIICWEKSCLYDSSSPKKTPPMLHTSLHTLHRCTAPVSEYLKEHILNRVLFLFFSLSKYCYLCSWPDRNSGQNQSSLFLQVLFLSFPDSHWLQLQMQVRASPLSLYNREGDCHCFYYITKGNNAPLPQQHSICDSSDKKLGKDQRK